MATHARYHDRKDEIRKVLEGRARSEKTIFYSELGPLVGIPPTGPWKPVLDTISHEDRYAGRPDITYLVVSKKTGLPAQIEFKAAKPPLADQKEIALKTIRSVFSYYRA
jgi:hypothetical protein